MENLIQVYYAKIPAQYGRDTLYPPARQREIEACASEKVRKEKYYAWKLLERAVQDFLGASITDLRFTKSKNGKWKSDRVEFSLSHSASAVAVALSRSPVGVDIQRVAPLKRTDFLRKVLTEEELALGHAIPSEEERTAYWIRKWTEKESAFKLLDAPAFFTAPPSNASLNTQTAVIDNEQYAITVASELPLPVTFIFIRQ